MLAGRRFGSGPPLVALHGFTLTGEQFAPAGALLERTIIAPDLPGHGGSVHESAELADVIDAIGTIVASVGDTVPIIGYSQGGRLALMTAFGRPQGIRALVLVSATAGIENAEDRASRAQSDRDMAAQLGITTIDEFLDRWTSTGITSTGHLTAELYEHDRSIRRQNSTDGLASALIGYGQGNQPSLWHELEYLQMPVLVMSGARDEKYSLIADAMAGLIPDAERVTIADAGHNPLLDTPDQAYGAISDFLHRHR